MKYKYTYKMLKDAGHSAFMALQIVMDATRKDKYAIYRIKQLFRLRDRRKH